MKIYVITHKAYSMPKDRMYHPLLVGAEGKRLQGYLRDDEGDNISSKNKNYCELTGLYWIWKNTLSDYVGVTHYRRLFAEGKKILSEESARKILSRTDIILPKERNYYIESNYSHYAHAHHIEDLDETRRIISEKYPEYLEDFDKRMAMTRGHRFNMFVMKKTLADDYCTWLFDILFELEKRIDISDYSDYDKRVFGFISERLIDVWIDKNNYRYRELPVLFLEKENWLKKGLRFLVRKVKGSLKESK